MWLSTARYLVLTDSGGIQEEGATLGRPLLVLREVTERPELIEAGAGILVGTDPERIVAEGTRLLADDGRAGGDGASAASLRGRAGGGADRRPPRRGGGPVLGPRARGEGGPVTPRLWVLLPAYEEAGSLGLLLADLARTLAAWPSAPPCRVVVVDDGSKDRTADVARGAKGLDLVVLVHEVNRGLGAAMRTGIEHVLAAGGDEDLLLSMDADHTHPPELIPGMVARAEAGADLVIASRFQPGARVEGLDLLRRGVSAAASGILRLVFPGARDYTCGYRCYRVGLLRWGEARYGRHFLNQQGFSVMVDLLLKLRRRARRIEEVPLVLRYDRKTSTSKMKLVRTARTTLALMGRRFRGDPRGP